MLGVKVGLFPWKYDKTPKVKREARAYKAQMESPSWEKTTGEFKDKIEKKRRSYDPKFH